MSVTPDEINEMVATLWSQSRARCLEVSPTAALAVASARPGDLRPGGFISGPTQFALADAALWFLASGALRRVEPMALTSELSIRFLRPARGDVIHARASLDRLGRRQLVATVRVWTDDETRPCAVAQGTYALPSTPSAA